MKQDEIENGKFYVYKNGHCAREVVSGGSDVFWRSYSFRDGEYISHGFCSRQAIATLCSREATPDEIAKLKVKEAIDEENRINRNSTIGRILSASDEELEEALRLRKMLRDE